MLGRPLALLTFHRLARAMAIANYRRIRAVVSEAVRKSPRLAAPHHRSTDTRATRPRGESRRSISTATLVLDRNGISPYKPIAFDRTDA